MGKHPRAWRYLKRPDAEVIECDNGWVFLRMPDIYIPPDAKMVTTEFGPGIQFEEVPPGEGHASMWSEKVTGVRVTIEHVQDARTGRWMLHLIINMRPLEREPSWEEYKAVRHAFFPHDVDTAIILPSTDQYVNVAEWAFHLWQLPEVWTLGIGWRERRRTPRYERKATISG